MIHRRVPCGFQSSSHLPPEKKTALCLSSFLGDSGHASDSNHQIPVSYGDSPRFFKRWQTYGTNVRRQYVYQFTLHGGVLHGAVLHGAVLHAMGHGVLLHGAMLHVAVLQGAVLHGAVLHNAVLHHAVLHHAVLHGAAYLHST